jgi:methyl-accepting chemotaxis protein
MTSMPASSTPTQGRFRRIGARLALGFFVTTCLTVISVIGCGWLLWKQDAQFAQVLDQSVPHLTQIQSVGSEVDAINLAARDALLAADDTAAAAALTRIEKGRSSIGQQIESLQSILGQSGQPGRALAEQLSSQSSGVLVTLVKFSRLHKAHRIPQAQALFGSELQGKMLAMSDTIKKAQALQIRDLAQQKTLSQRRLNATLELGCAGLVLVVALSATLAWRLSVGIIQPISEAVKLVQHVANGDLSSTVHVTSHDEVGDLLKAMIVMQERLSELVNGILQTVNNISHTSVELAAGNAHLNDRTDRASETLKSTSEAMSQLAMHFEESAQAAKLADQLVSTASAGVTRSGDVVAQVVSNMEDISTSSSKIVDIIGVIDGIAFQTNILALNAAVEAARAGEQGRGFAVVAAEVRALAQRSASAAKEIKTLISASAEKVHTGSQLVSEAGRTMRESMAQVEQVNQLIRNISQISQQQTSGVNQVNASVNELDEATQRNAVLVHQTSAAGQNLQAETSRLTEAVSAFKLA